LSRKNIPNLNNNNCVYDTIHRKNLKKTINCHRLWPTTLETLERSSPSESSLYVAPPSSSLKHKIASSLILMAQSAANKRGPPAFQTTYAFRNVESSEKQESAARAPLPSLDDALMSMPSLRCAAVIQRIFDELILPAFPTARTAVAIASASDAAAEESKSSQVTAFCQSPSFL
jgi:hypothetical protein